MTAVTTASLPEQRLGELRDRLRYPVWVALVERGSAIRRSLPDRPATACERYSWWRALTPDQERRAMLLDRLEALCGHLGGTPALGYDTAEVLPEEALQEAEGFDEALSALISQYRRLRLRVMDDLGPGGPVR
jgi:hypothetical protein